jgi:hypothetical protein
MSASSNEYSKLHNFSVYYSEFHNHFDKITMKSVGWNSRELKIIPLYKLRELSIVPNGDLLNLKPFDVVYFDNNRAYDSYLVVPLKLKEKMNVEIDDTTLFFKELLLSYGLIPFEFDCSGETSCIPPEGLEAIEKHGKFFFEIIINEELDDVEGIIVDHMYIKNNFHNLHNKAQIIGEPYEYDKIAFLWAKDSYQLTLNDASDEQLENMKNAQMIIPFGKKSSKPYPTIEQLLEPIMKNLPDTRADPYMHSFTLYEKKEMNANNTILPNKKEVRKDEEKKKPPNFKSMKKDELVQLLQEKCSKIEELETTLFHTTNDLKQITEQYKEMKSKSSNFENDSNYLKRNVGQGIDNMRQLICLIQFQFGKIEIELNKIKPQYC